MIQEPDPGAERVGPSGKDISARPLNEAVRALEIRLLKEALEGVQYNQRKAAQTLGLTYHQFRGLYRKYKSHLT